MSLTVSQGEGLTVITISSNPKSKWPVLCQILRLLCCSPVCFVSQSMKGKLTNIHTALGILQMIVGVLNIVVGFMFLCLGLYYNMYIMAMGPFWLGSMFFVAGIVCILAAKFPSSCLLVIGMILNIGCAALAITGVVLYTVDLAFGHSSYNYGSCQESYKSYSGPGYGGYGSYNRYITPTTEETRKLEACLYYRSLIEELTTAQKLTALRIFDFMAFGGLDILMVMLSVLQFCVNISFCVLTGKVLRKKDEDAKSVEDPELHKPLLEDAVAAPAC